VRGSEQVRGTPYALAAIPARFAIERGAWKEAAQLQPQTTRFPFTAGLTHFARALGAARSGDAAAAERDVQELARIVDALRPPRMPTGRPKWKCSVWALARGSHTPRAIATKRSSSCAPQPSSKRRARRARSAPGAWSRRTNCSATLLLESGKPAEALAEYERSQVRDPNRFRSLYGAGQAAAQSGNRDKVRYYFSRLVDMAGSGNLRIGAPSPSRGQRHLFFFLDQTSLL
jgi:hypothetical protein